MIGFDNQTLRNSRQADPIANGNATVSNLTRHFKND